jgi:hypothetical protein
MTRYARFHCLLARLERRGLLSSGKPEEGVMALLKRVSGPSDIRVEATLGNQMVGGSTPSGCAISPR